MHNIPAAYFPSPGRHRRCLNFLCIELIRSELCQDTVLPSALWTPRTKTWPLFEDKLPKGPLLCWQVTNRLALRAWPQVGYAHMCEPVVYTCSWHCNQCNLPATCLHVCSSTVANLGTIHRIAVHVFVCILYVKPLRFSYNLLCNTSLLVRFTTVSCTRTKRLVLSPHLHFNMLWGYDGIGLNLNWLHFK